MNSLFFAAAGFGLLMSLEKGAGEKISLKNFRFFLKTGLEIFAVSTLLAGIGYFLIPRLPLKLIRGGEFLILLFLPLGYEWQRTQKKSWIVYLTAVGFSFFAVENAGNFEDCLYISARLAAVATLLRVLLQGLRSRLLLTPPPSKAAGVAFLFFLAALLALVLNPLLEFGK